MSILKGKSKTSKVVITILIALFVFVLISASLFSYYAVRASGKNVYQGISLGSIDIGGMSKPEVVKTISEKYSNESLSFTLECDGEIFNLYGSDFNLKIDPEATADKALSYGKTGNMIYKIKNMLSLKNKPQSINLAITCDYDALQYIINENLGAKLEDVQEYSVEFGENELIVFNGKSGKIVPAQKIIDSIAASVTNGNLAEPIKADIEVKNPTPIDAEKFADEYNRPAKDAVVEKNGDEIIITPEVVGVELERETAIKILEANKNSTRKYTIPAKITYPDITAKDLEEEYTDTLIATYSTKYSTSSENRKTNIHLASEKINGLVLNPGEVFSFNTVVGPRNAANGYKMAQSYSGSKVVEDLGGGICQVSSTLYNAVVFADLEIVFRRNHSMPVSYTPLGRDATVSYGSIDFKFKNSHETPIKFEVLHDGETLTVNVYGRKKYIKDISIETAITGSVPFSVTEIKDDTMYIGETKVEEAGSNGTIVESFKIVKENGEVVSRTLLAKSTYTPHSKVVKIGTKEPEETPLPPVEEVIPQPEQTATPAPPPESEQVVPIDPPATEEPLQQIDSAASLAQ